MSNCFFLWPLASVLSPLACSMVAVAQLAERLVVSQVGAGSNPVGHPCMKMTKAEARMSNESGGGANIGRRGLVFSAFVIRSFVIR